MADKENEIRLDKRYRIYIRDGVDPTIVGMDESLFEYTPVIIDPETGETTGGEWIPKVEYMIDFGASVTYTWAIGKYYEHDDPAKVLDKYVKKELDTNA